MKFIDLFAGLGGFHLALERLGCECVFASELKEDLQNLYVKNFPGTRIEGDITEISPSTIPPHDILCAGFPCQPFSVAGKRMGFDDEKGRGNLFNNICDIIDEHQPRYLVLENVAHLLKHDDGRTWNHIKSMLEERNYEVRHKIISPHQFGIPQHRERIYIICEHHSYGRLEHFNYPVPQEGVKSDINSIIDSNVDNYVHLESSRRKTIALWQEFIDLCVSNNCPIPHHSLWVAEWGADYDYLDTPPGLQSIDRLRGRKGIMGKVIEGNTLEECLQCLPPYSRTAKKEKSSEWKKNVIRKNREFYAANKSWIDPWKEKMKECNDTHRKFEWQCGDNVEFTLYDKILQFRQSGLRVKHTAYSPALTLNITQTPIFPWIELKPDTLSPNEPKHGRYMTLSEAAKIQGMETLNFEGLTPSRSWEALGNAVNSTIVQLIVNNLLHR